MVTDFKSLTIAAALLAGGTSLAQHGLPTGGKPPVAGGRRYSRQSFSARARAPDRLRSVRICA
jgi:hypothetical protein